MSKIKICGIQYPEEIKILNQLLPDYIGFVFAPSKRQITIKQAEKLKGLLSPQIKVVGVYVNSDIESIVYSVKAKSIDLVQLHGDEDEGYIKELKRQINVPIIKVVRVDESMSLPEGDMDYYLFDKKSSKAYGGLGESFDWTLLKKIKKPYFLAGGIGIDNITEALGYKPYCVDLSSKVETNGMKDKYKIQQVLGKVRMNCG
ncbi:MAG: phosphoribosylanthranilate isomerase [Niameybacter sp.]